MTPLNKYDLLFATRRLPKSLIEVMKKNMHEIVIAGGYIRAIVANETINDIDLFTTSKEKAEIVANELASSHPGWSKYDTDNAITIRGPRPAIQIIHRWTFPTPESILPSFDFTIAQAAIWWNGNMWESLCHPSYYSDLAGKRLIYTNPQRNEDAGGSMLRVLKFYQRGYRIPLDSLGMVITRLVQGLDVDKLKTSSGLNPEMTSKVITGLLREVDPLTDADHIFHLGND